MSVRMNFLFFQNPIVKDADVVITTARLFGANAPKLFFGKENNDKMTREMKEGAVTIPASTATSNA